MKITLGALAHVDAGKTTLSEAILYKSNVIRSKGKIDNKDCFLDFNDLEKQKGITIYNKQALFSYLDKDYIYIDTPGHSDLAYESNRALNILDCAILIVSAIEDIPSDTIKQFNNLLNYNIPIIIFVNKMDISNFSKDEILSNLKNKLGEFIIDYNETEEYISLLSEQLLDDYLKTNTIDPNIVSDNLKNNKFVPCFFGSALKDIGIEELLDYINKYVNTNYDDNHDLNAYIYRINEDYSYIKVLSGTLNNKQIFGEYKVNEIYIINGNNYSPIGQAKAGDIVAVKGLKQIAIGTYLPSFNYDVLMNIPSLTYRVLSNLDTNELYKKLETLNLEYPELKIRLEDGSIFINLNGELHATIVSNMILERLNVEVRFSEPIIRYKETINNVSYGVGHFEPLRHYAEVIVKIEPNENGIKINSLIENNYINTILSYLRNHNLRGILTNSQLDNVQITIVDIKTHPKHTEGGDLINATKRAIRHGLSKNENIILEPLYLTSIDTNSQTLNTIISSLTAFKCAYIMQDDKLISKIPLIIFNDVITNLKSKLKGNISYNIESTIFDRCDNQEEIIDKYNYDYLSDTRNPVGSIFCKSGAGHYVEPQDVEANMHLDMSNYVPKEYVSVSHNKTSISDEELKRVWNSLYKQRQRYIPNKADKQEERVYKPTPSKPLMYLIDGYNLMYYLDEQLSINDLISAREKIINIVCDFAGYVEANTVLVFDAYIANGSSNEIIQRDNITIVYTKYKQTADTYIEQKSRELRNEYKVIVVTNDNLEQLTAYVNSASVISSKEFLARYENLKKNNTYQNKKLINKPFEDLKQLLLED